MATFRNACTTLIVIGSLTACGEATEDLSPEPADLSSAAFVPDQFFPNDDAEHSEEWIGEEAELVAAVPIEGGELRFIDETPSASEPSISYVVVEPDQPESVLDVVRHQSASPLELFLTVAPNLPIPAKLELDHLAHFAERGLSPEPRKLDPDVVPRFEDDDWGPECADAANWAAGFNSWSWSAAARQHLAYLYPNYAPEADVHGYFGTYDYIWAGVCIHNFGYSPHDVEMQYWNGSFYTTIAGTYQWVPRKDRYLYYSAYTGAPARRLKVYEEGPQDQFLVSGGWKEPPPIGG